MGQTNHNGLRYYRHRNTKRRVRQCPLSVNPHVPADGPGGLEQQVISELFNLFGNPAAIEKAMRAAMPNMDRVRKQRKQIESELAKIQRGRDRVLKLITDELVSDADAERQLEQLKLRENQLRKQQDTLDQFHVPDADDIRNVALYVEKIGDSIILTDDGGNEYVGGNDVVTWMSMTGDDRKKLIETAFASPHLDGSPAGVYITVNPKGRQRFSYNLRGILNTSRLSRASY